MYPVKHRWFWRQINEQLKRPAPRDVIFVIISFSKDGGHYIMSDDRPHEPKKEQHKEEQK